MMLATKKSNHIIPINNIPNNWKELLCMLPKFNPLDWDDKPYHFNQKKVELCFDFFETKLVHVEGTLANKPFKLEDWEKSWLANIFGIVYQDHNDLWVRRFRESLLYVARKNGKSPLVAGLGLFVTLCDNELGQQNIIASTKREQAGKLFRHMELMVRKNDLLHEKVRIYGGKATNGQSKSILVKDVNDNSQVQVISSEGDTEHGGNLHLAMIEELHTFKNMNLLDVLETSTASENRKNPLFISLTTADNNKFGPCYKKLKFARAVQENKGNKNKGGYFPWFLPAVYELPDEITWEELKSNEELWKLSNPNLGVSVSLDYLRNQVAKADNDEEHKQVVLQLHFNRIAGIAGRWLSKYWYHSKGYSVDDLKGETCFGGLDLMSTADICSYVLTFKLNDYFQILPIFWIPELSIKKRTEQDGLPYQQWIDKGLIRIAGTKRCDYNIVKQEIIELSKLYDIEKTYFDPRECSMLAMQLQDEGMEVEGFSQTYNNYNEICKLFEQFVIEKMFEHNNNDVFDWMIDNVVLMYNNGGYCMPSRLKSYEKIDGIVACIMSFFGWKRDELFSEEDWFDDAGYLTENINESN